MKRLEGEARKEFLRRLDRRLSRLFLVLLALEMVVVAIVALGSGDPVAALVVFASLLTGIFFLVGLVAWISMGDHGILRTTRMFQFTIAAAAVVALLSSVGLYFYGGGMIYFGAPGAGGEIDPRGDPAGTAIVFLALTLALFGVQLTVLCEGFGTIWFTGKVIRRLMPGVLKGVRRATFGKHDGADTKLMLWLMDIPNILDLSQLKVEAEPPRTSFPWDRFLRAVLWEVFLGTILAIYISLNPLLLESLDIVQVFSVLGALAVVIPIIIIPWFALLALRARIPGVTRDFLLFDGIRSRILQTFVALGTIVVFIRLALREHDPTALLGSFLSYYMVLGVLAAYFAFVYFNFFEADLASAAEKRYRELG